MRRSNIFALLSLLGMVFCTAMSVYASPYFLIDSEAEWTQAMSLGRVQPVSAPEWQDYMIQWINFLQEGEPYPTNVFLPPELYVWPGGGGGGLNPEDAGLVMTWRAPRPGSYSSAWKYEYGLDPDLTGCTINVTVTAPQFDPSNGNQVNNVSFGIRDVNGNIRAWHWNCGPGAPIQWNTPTQITINPMVLSINATNPVASGFANNPMFNIAQSANFIVDENAVWVAQQGVPPPGQTVPAMWNYWHNLYVTPPIPGKNPDPIKWSQPVVEYQPGLQPPVFLGWDERSLYKMPPICADDWECTDERPVTDVHWWGSFVGWTQPQPPQLPRAFHLAIWTDVPAGPNNPFSHPGVMVWEHFCNTYTWNFAGYDYDPRHQTENEACFQFHQYLPREKWFYQDPGPQGRNVYWLSIAAIYDEPEVQYPWGWKTRPHFFNDDAVRIWQVFDPAGNSGWPPHVGWLWAQGQPIVWEGKSWDLAFELTTTAPQVGTLTIKENHRIYDHFWWLGDPDPDNEMASLLGMADAVEGIFWNSITLQASGSGNDAFDIAAINVWADNDNDGKVTPGDTLLGTGTYPVDDGTVSINLVPAPLIPAGSAFPIVISYTMSPTAAVGSTYRFAVAGAAGVGQVSGMPVAVVIDPAGLTGATKIVGLKPISIGTAKKLPIGMQFLLDGKICTANFQTNMGLFYIEEPNRSAGIGVNTSGSAVPTPVNIWDRVSVLGVCSLINGTELVVTPQYITVTPGIAPPMGSPRFAVGMNNKWTGGGVFGGQPAVYDNAWSDVQSVGLNNVSMLITTWGEVTYHQPGFALPPMIPPIPLGDMFWINDGTNLLDGTTNMVGGRNVGVAVWLPRGYPGLPNPGEYWGVTGILRTFRSPMSFPNPEPVRLLIPRMPSDLVRYN